MGICDAVGIGNGLEAGSKESSENIHIVSTFSLALQSHVR